MTAEEYYVSYYKLDPNEDLHNEALVKIGLEITIVQIFLKVDLQLILNNLKFINFILKEEMK